MRNIAIGNSLFTINPYGQIDFNDFQTSIESKPLEDALDVMDISVGKTIDFSKNPFGVYFDAATGVKQDNTPNSKPVALGSNVFTTIIGSEFTDILFGNNDANHIEGGNGDDSLLGEGGNDTIYGGDGHDLIYGDGSSKSLTGSDVIYGGKGKDFISVFGLSGSQYDTSKNTVYGGEDSDDIFGAHGDDSLSGDEGDDYINGNLGQDTIAGGTGNDYISDLHDNNTIYGGIYNKLTDDAGNDRIWTGWGKDKIYDGDSYTENLKFEDRGDVIISGAGDDTIIVNGKFDQVESGADNDSVSSVYSFSGQYNLGDGDDSIEIVKGGMNTIKGGNGDDVLNAGTGNNTLYGGEDSDIFVIKNDIVATNNLIMDFSIAQNDKIQFVDTSLKNFTDVQNHSFVFDSNTVIASDNVRVELHLVELSTLSANNFLF